LKVKEKAIRTYDYGYDTELKLIPRLWGMIRHRGFKWLIIGGFVYVVNIMSQYFLNKRFEVGEVQIKYVYNTADAANTERCVEIPFAKYFLTTHIKDDTKILEIGNVLGYYGVSIKRKIIDKYERNGEGIINSDIVDYDTAEKFDIIISISTIEHIGYDEPVKEQGKSRKALLKIMDLINNGGWALISVPLGYNPEIDDIVYNDLMKFSECYFLKRTSILNRWTTTTRDDALKCKYWEKYPAANSVAFLIYNKKYGYLSP
jgi:hypothetical protein